jgi:hypothetical protein
MFRSPSWWRRSRPRGSLAPKSNRRKACKQIELSFKQRRWQFILGAPGLKKVSWDIVYLGRGRSFDINPTFFRIMYFRNSQVVLSKISLNLT